MLHTLFLRPKKSDSFFEGQCPMEIQSRDFFSCNYHDFWFLTYPNCKVRTSLT